MAYDIRPLSFGEILDRAFRVYLDNFLLLFGIAAIFWIPSGILGASGGVVDRGVATTLDSIFFMVAAPAMHAALIVGVASVYLDRPISIGEAYRSVRPIVLPFIGTYLLYLLLFAFSMGTAAGAFAAISAAPVLGAAVLAVMLLVLLGAVIVEIYFLVYWSLVASVMVVERRFGKSALRRSRQLVTGSWWLTLGVVLGAALIVNVPGRTLRFVWGFIPAIGVILTQVTYGLMGTYGTVVFVIYYFDRRCRTEDFDLRLLAEQVRAETQTATPRAPDSSALA